MRFGGMRWLSLPSAETRCQTSCAPLSQTMFSKMSNDDRSLDTASDWSTPDRTALGQSNLTSKAHLYNPRKPDGSLDHTDKVAN